jgi:hypothetical protein
MHQHRFSLIVSLMGNKYGIDLLSQGGSSEKGIPSRPRLSRCCPRRKASVVDDRPEPPRCCNRSDKIGICCRLGPAQTVVEVSNNRYWSTGSLQCVEHVQERQRIAAPRHCNQHSIGRLTNTLGKQELMQLIEHSITR